MSEESPTAGLVANAARDAPDRPTLSQALEFMESGANNMQLDRIDAAISDFSVAISLEPTNDILYACRGAAYQRNAFLETARKDFVKAAAFNPNNAEAAAFLQTYSGVKRFLWRAFIFSLKFPGRLFGAKVYIHWTVLLAIILLTLQLGKIYTGSNQYSGEGIFIGIVVSVGFMLSILFHEMSHGWAMYYIYGIQVRVIILHILGGMTIPINGVDSLIAKNGKEAVTSIVGPLFNLVVGGIFYGINAAIPTHEHRGLHYVFYFMFVVNMALGVFNILPAFPMDGGRVVRSLFYICMTLKRATQGTTVITLLCSAGILVGAIYLKDPLTGFTAGLIVLLALGELYRVSKLKDDTTTGNPHSTTSQLP